MSEVTQKQRMQHIQPGGNGMVYVCACLCNFYTCATVCMCLLCVMCFYSV